MSIGAMGDSFYEYLLKAWIQSNKEDNEARQIFDDAMQAIMQQMLQTSPSGLMYFADLKFDRLEHKMDHLGCFSGMYSYNFIIIVVEARFSLKLQAFINLNVSLTFLIGQKHY